jgi:hypothetical protein
MKDGDPIDFPQDSVIMNIISLILIKGGFDNIQEVVSADFHSDQPR